MAFSPDMYRRAMEFAAKAHGTQRVPGTEMPYLVHLVSVAAEVLAASTEDTFDIELATTTAILHDTLEDTSASEDEIVALFGATVARGVRALSKNAALPKNEQMADSLRRIQAERREIWIVKLADRISNLGPPPAYWTREKRVHYQIEAGEILQALGKASAPLATRLEAKIKKYSDYLDERA